jgi:hypothetical protein
VFVLGLRFDSVGDTSVTADVRIHEITILVADSLGAPIDSVFSNVTVADGDIEFGSLTGVIPEGIGSGAAQIPDVQPILPFPTGIIRIPLATPIVLPVNTSVSTDLRVAVLPNARHEWIRFRLDAGDSTLLPKARDVATDAPVAVSLAAPFEGPAIRLASRASGLVARPVAVPNASAFPGTAGVPLLSFSCRHPGGPGEADVALYALTLQISDDLGAPQVAGRRLLSLTAFADGVAIGSVNVAESDVTRPTIPIASPFLIAAGDSAWITVRTTIRGIAEPGRVRASIDRVDVDARDANEGTSIAPTPEGATFPFGSALLTILALPLDPIATFHDRAPVTVAQGAREVPLAELILANPPTDDAGGVGLESIRFALSDSDGRELDAASLFASTRVIAGGSVVASSGPPDAPCCLTFEGPLEIAPGDSVVLTIDGDLLDAPAAAAFRLTLADSGVVFASVGAGTNAPRARAAAGQSFPFATGLIGIAAPRFSESLSNYPNPFAAGREATRFLFFMPEPGDVEIAIYTAFGEPVTRIALRNVSGPAMTPQIVWDGRNADGDAVLSGVYVADVRVHYASGRSESALRKVAVLR